MKTTVLFLSLLLVSTLSFAQDTDMDGVPDVNDNCVTNYNPNQSDFDTDGVGDVCDQCLGDDATGDSDGDGVCDNQDQCPGYDDALDSDADGTADGCDICDGYTDIFDSDGDGMPDGCDVCWGDDASGDSDGDGVCDDIDWCIGDDSTGDMDGDGVCEDMDMCIGNDATGDSDGDGLCDDYDPLLVQQDIIACNSYTWVEGTVFTNSVSNADHYALNPEGHDTIYILNLTIVEVNMGIIEGGEGQDLYLFSQQDNAQYNWVNCSNGVSFGATDQIFFPETSGSYAVEISYQGCVTMTDCYEFGFAEIVENSNVQVILAPNPVEQVLTIRTSTSVAFAYAVTDLTGKVIHNGHLSGSQTSLDVSHLPEGVYFLSTGGQVQRFMVAR
jgi:hypothetical protein